MATKEQERLNSRMSYPADKLFYNEMQHLGLFYWAVLAVLGRFVSALFSPLLRKEEFRTLC